MQTLLQIGRLAQFTAAAIAFGLPAFRLHAIAPHAIAPPQPPTDDARWGAVLAGACMAGAAGVLLWAMMQAASMSDMPHDALGATAVWGVLTQMHVGRVALVRAGLLLLVLVLALTRARSRAAMVVQATLGASIIASFAWSGHGAIPGGWLGRLHLAADVIHLLAAGLWIGGLAAFCVLVAPSASNVVGDQNAGAAQDVLHRALLRFSGIGSAIVAAILLTGMVNTWMLVGLAHWQDVFRTKYGILLLVKLGLFCGMLGFAALNRFVLTPSLANSTPRPVRPASRRALRRSIVAETVLAILVLAAVSIIGTLPPPISGA